MSHQLLYEFIFDVVVLGGALLALWKLFDIVISWYQRVMDYLDRR